MQASWDRVEIKTLISYFFYAPRENCPNSSFCQFVIVKHQYWATRQFRRCRCDYFFVRPVVPKITAQRCPHDQPVVQRPRGGYCIPREKAKRRTKKSLCMRRGLRNFLFALEYLAHCLLHRKSDPPCMVESVDTDAVSFRRYVTNQWGRAYRGGAAQEKCRFHILRLQNTQYFRSCSWMRTVVECEVYVWRIYPPFEPREKKLMNAACMWNHEDTRSRRVEIFFSPSFFLSIQSCRRNFRIRQSVQREGGVIQQRKSILSLLKRPSIF